jgi:hypothetical protein
MKTEQQVWTKNAGWDRSKTRGLNGEASLALVFGATEQLRQPEHLKEIHAQYPGAHIVGCSTAGEIRDIQVLDDSLVVTAVGFDSTKLQHAETELSSPEESFAAGQRLAKALKPDGLVHALVISDGLKVNGTQLVQGLVSCLPPGVAVTGGLSGDGARFQETLVCTDSGAGHGKIAIVGFYGDHLKVGYGSMGGWDTFGPDRLITRSRGNVLYELDGQSALDLYKRYLGEHAAGLPASGLLFPLSVRLGDNEQGVVRTILAIDENDHSLTFAGDVPEGSYARLMRANFERLIDGANGAARTSYQSIGSAKAELGILISCVGRKLVLKQRIEEEVESVRDVLGPAAALTGFYSYGEISPFTHSAKCELHNQTMTITTFSEQ